MEQRRIFRTVAFVLIAYYAINSAILGTYMLARGLDLWGGGLIFLSNWNLVVNLVIAGCALYREYDKNFIGYQPLLAASMGLNIIVVLLYWVLRAMGAFGDGIEDDWELVDHIRNIYIHLGTSVFLFIEAIFFNKPFQDLKKEYAIYMAIFVSYILWMEFFVSPNNPDWNCSETRADSCGFPYLFLNDLSEMGRLIFYFGVWILGNGALAFSYYLYNYKERNWSSEE